MIGKVRRWRGSLLVVKRFQQLDVPTFFTFLPNTRSDWEGWVDGLRWRRGRSDWSGEIPEEQKCFERERDALFLLLLLLLVHRILEPSKKAGLRSKFIQVEWFNCNSILLFCFFSPSLPSLRSISRTKIIETPTNSSPYWRISRQNNSNPSFLTWWYKYLILQFLFRPFSNHESYFAPIFVSIHGSFHYHWIKSHGGRMVECSQSWRAGARCVKVRIRCHLWSFQFVLSQETYPCSRGCEAGGRWLEVQFDFGPWNYNLSQKWGCLWNSQYLLLEGRSCKSH